MYVNITLCKNITSPVAAENTSLHNYQRQSPDNQRSLPTQRVFPCDMSKKYQAVVYHTVYVMFIFSDYYRNN